MDRPQSSTWRLTRAQARHVDGVCVDEYGIPSIVLMENAAIALYVNAREMFDRMQRRVKGTNPSPRVLIICGGGNNGGDGYALARHLDNAGHSVVIAAARPVGELTGDAGINAQIAQRMGLVIHPATAELVRTVPADLVVDALFGTGLDRPPRADAAALIQAMNARAEPTLAVDIPSGLDCDTGRPLGSPDACVRAARTVTMVAEKVGFTHARRWVGEVVVADIGAPRAAIERVMQGHAPAT